MDAQTVAAGVGAAHEAARASPLYNDERALRAVVRAACLSSAGYHVEIQELPSA